MLEISLSELEAARAKGDETLVELLRERTGKSPTAIRTALLAGAPPDSVLRLLAACDNDAALAERVCAYATLLRADYSSYPVVVTPGSVYVTAGADRRSTGTHYTPRVLTEEIVRYTLEPLVYVGPAEDKPAEDWTLRSAGELLALKVCDMAMGSGAFLVQAARYLADRLMEAWRAAEQGYRVADSGGSMPRITPESALAGPDDNDAVPADDEERRILALRVICDRCLYGVDKNAIAVEMAVPKQAQRDCQRRPAEDQAECAERDRRQRSETGAAHDVHPAPQARGQQWIEPGAQRGRGLPHLLLQLLL